MGIHLTVVTGQNYDVARDVLHSPCEAHNDRAGIVDLLACWLTN